MCSTGNYEPQNGSKEPPKRPLQGLLQQQAPTTGEPAAHGTAPTCQTVAVPKPAVEAGSKYNLALSGRRVILVRESTTTGVGVVGGGLGGELGVGKRGVIVELLGLKPLLDQALRLRDAPPCL